MPVFSKPPLSIRDQVLLLQSRGLVVLDVQRAERYLSNISYYRLSAYTVPFQLSGHGHAFSPGSSFEQVIKLYVFDRKLRMHVFDAIERIEVAVRAQIIQQLSMRYGSHWHEKRMLFKEVHYASPSVYNALEREIASVCNRSRKEVFIKHYLDAYTDPPLPASWMCFETLTLGMLSRVFEGLADSDDRRAIASHFKLPPTVLESWLHSFTYIRNICAHHSRLWNRELGVSPLYLKATTRGIGPWMSYPYPPNGRMYYVLCCLMYMLRQISPSSTFSARTQELISAYSPLPGVGIGATSNCWVQPVWL